MNKIQNLVKLRAVMNQTPSTPEVHKRAETSTTLPMQNPPQSNIIAQVNTSAASKQFESFFM
jgi:hypothetical protein